MTTREAIALIVAFTLVVAGVALVYSAAAFIVAGILVAAFVLFYPTEYSEE